MYHLLPLKKRINKHQYEHRGTRIWRRAEYPKQPRPIVIPIKDILTFLRQFMWCKHRYYGNYCIECGAKRKKKTNNEPTKDH